MSPPEFEDVAGLGFEQVLRSAPVAIAVIDAAGGVFYSNARAQELMRRQLGNEMPADLDGAVEILHPDATLYERQQWLAVRSITTGEEIVDEEFSYALPEGARLFIRCNSSPLRDKDGKIVAAVVAMADVTEQKRQEERLTHLAGLLDNTEDAIVALDAQWFVTMWNAGAERLYGWTADEVLGRHTLEVAQLEMSHEERTEVRLAVAERGRWRGEVVAYCKDGSSVSVELITVALRDAQGQISGYLGIHRDISERRRAAAALREADLRNRNVLESITDDFFAFDEHWGYVYVNDRALQSINNALATNFTRDDLAGKSVWDLFPGFADDPLYAEQEAALREGRPVHVEHYLAVDDRWMDVHAYPCNGGLTIFTHDITDRKRAQEALRAAQHHRETVLESISEEFFAVDREWRYTYVNERALAQARKVAGRDFTAEEMLGMTLWELFPQVRGTRFERELHRAMREQTIVEFEVHSELTGRWLEVRLHPTEVGLAGYTHDISDRKAAQEEIGRRAKQQALIADLGLKALGSEDLQLLFDEAVGVVARTLDVELASVAEMSAGSEEVILRAGVGWDVDAGRRIEPGALAQAHGVVSALSVMIAGPDEPFGALRALSTSRRTFSPSDVSVLQSVANVLAGAVELTRARKRLDQVRRAERSRIARDLHDDALQELTGALVQAEGGRSEGLGAQHVGQLGSSLKRVGEQLRGAIYDLRLEDQEERGFAQLLEGLVALHRAMAVDSQVELDAEDGVPSTPLGRRGTEILRLIGEALTNARRHSHAASIRVSARGSREHLCIEVIDDGRGFDAGADPGSASGTGILGMHERAALLDADLDITSRPGRGTTVRLEVALGAALPGERRTGGP